jgi:uncharacterized membrane protein YkvA (DUF1232 family)
MTELETRCLDAFPEWLRGLAEDARLLTALVENAELPESARRQCAVGLNYLFKSLDLIPDGIEDLGFIDDAFVLRVVAVGAIEGNAAARTVDGTGTLARLAEESDLVKEFMGEDYGRLASYIRGLESMTVRGRSVDDILRDEAVRADLLREVRGWAEGYTAPGFSRDEKNLVKLRSFLGAKLPA